MGELIGAVAAQAQGDCNMARRDKYWAELTDAEKIERMHTQVKMLMRQVESMGGIVANLRDHRHGSDGGLLVPMSNRNSMSESAGYRRGEEWF